MKNYPLDVEILREGVIFGWFCYSREYELNNVLYEKTIMDCIITCSCNPLCIPSTAFLNALHLDLSKACI